MMMQLGGSAQRANTRIVQNLMDESKSFRRLLLHYVHTMIIQRDETALAASKGSIEQRLARWLLMSSDRVGDDEIHLTHDLISVMLGCRRAGVTTAIGELERRGFVDRGGRGFIRLIDREGLTDICKAYYGAADAEFARLYPNRVSVN